MMDRRKPTQRQVAASLNFMAPDPEKLARRTLAQKVRTPQAGDTFMLGEEKIRISATRRGIVSFSQAGRSRALATKAWLALCATQYVADVCDTGRINNRG